LAQTKCPLCLNTKPLIEEHHEIPRAAGGEGGPTIFICSECHKALHACAQKILARNGTEATQIAQATFKNQAKAKELIKSIVASTLKKRDGRIPDEQVPYRLTLVFPGPMRRYLEVLAKDTRRSIVEYAQQIIIQHICNQFPKDNIKEIVQNAKNELRGVNV